MIDLFKEIDFSKELEQKKFQKVFLIEAAKKVEAQQSEIIRKIKKPEVDEELLNHFVIIGIPLLTEQKQAGFITLLKTKVFDVKKIGEKNGLERIDVGKENGVYNRTLYLIYKTPAEAKVAFNKLNNLKFTAKDIFTCYTIKEIQEVLSFQEQKSQPRIMTLAEKTEHNFDEEHRTQFIVREGNNIFVNWLDYLDKSSPNALTTEFIQNQHQTNKVVFSPLGNYMAVCTNIGTLLFAGKQMRLKGIYRQKNPIDVKFSSNQRYMITFNGSNMIKERQNFIIWGVEEQIQLKSYKAYSHQNLDSFQFSDDSQNLAIVLNGQIRFYSTISIQEFKVQLKLPQDDGNTLKVPHIQKIAWLKTNASIICVCYEIDYNPVNVAATKVFIYNVKTKEERKWRAWSEHAKNGEIFVSERGDWVAISLRKFIKRNHYATVIQIGNLMKKQEPLEVTSVQIREQIGNISWDWSNNRFAVVHEDQATKKGINVRYVAVFYQIVVKNKSLEISKLHQIKNNLQNRIVLSKNGSFFALYNISEESPENGKVSFGLIVRDAPKDPKDKNKKITFQFIKQNVMINKMCFFNVDPTGRFILLGTEKSFQVWNFIGEVVTKDTLQKNIHDVIWRPRFESSLDQKEEKALLDQQKQIRKKYEQIDDKRINILKYQKEQSKKKQKIEFLDFVTRKRVWYQKFKPLREKILGFKEEDVRTELYEVVQSLIQLD